MTNFVDNLRTNLVRYVSASNLRDLPLARLTHLLGFLTALHPGLLLALFLAFIFTHLMRSNYVWARHSFALNLGHGHTHLHLLLGALLLLLVPGHLPVLAHLLRHGLLHRFLNLLADLTGHRVAPLAVHSVAFLLGGGHAVDRLHVLANHPGYLVALSLGYCVALLLLAGLTVGGGYVLALEDRRLCARLLAVLAPGADFLRLVAALPAGGGDAILQGDRAALLPGHVPAHLLRHLAALPLLHRTALLTCDLVTLL